MPTTNLLILEDDMIIAADISLHLTRLGYEVTCILSSGEDAIVQVQQEAPDLMLVDINLKGDLDGVETVHKIRQLRPEIGIIYLTANSDEATYNRAKATQPEAFISKPFKRLDLARAIELAIIRLAGAEESAIADQATDQDEAYILEDRVFVKQRDRMIKIYVRDILYAEADRNYCKIYAINKEYLITLPLKVFEEKLNSPAFLRIHRSYIINLKHIDELSPQNELVSIGGKNLPVSRSLREELNRRLKVI